MSSEPPAPVPRYIRNDGKIRARMIGMSHHPLKDVYFRLLRSSWWVLLGLIAVIYTVINAVFAVIYVVSGGIEGAQAGSFQDAFFFSVQTMATIGYGVMHPRTPLANGLVTLEALIGLLGVAMATGLLYSKFARPSSQLLFSRVAVIATREGTPCLMFRVANERANHVAEATVRLSLLRNETTAEGEWVRRWYDLPLQRSYSPAFALTWTVLHSITPDSKLFGLTHEELMAQHIEIVVTLVAHDLTLAAGIHARYVYASNEIIWGARFTDLLDRDEQGVSVLDMKKFHDTVEQPLPTDVWAAPVRPPA